MRQLTQLIIVRMIALLLAAGVALAWAGTAAAAATKQVDYRGLRLEVPRSWPVYDLARAPRTCVRFNRHAVYLGRPGPREDCPAAALGHTEAILVSPPSGGLVAGARLPAGGAQGPDGSVAQLFEHGLLVTATWGRDPALVRRTLHDPRLGTSAGSSPPAMAHAARAASKSSSVTAKAAASVYAGTGFDTCEDPSSAQLQAWLASTYRGVGVYIGGANMGCSQPNLNAAYVSQAVAEGWYLIPTYVGLQAPGNSCGCAAITPSQAAAQGAAAAEDAVSDAEAVGIGAGSPIYDDMEAYSTGGSHTTTVLTFLSAWTNELHALGYLSGVYSSSDSGIHDLVAANGDPSYTMPDDIWIADWNGEQTTADGSVPSGDWNDNQRLHQYEGGHDETWGGVKLDVDSDEVDGATVGAGTVTAAPPPTTPAVTITPQPDGAIKLDGSWSGVSGIAYWRAFGGSSATSLSPLSNPSSSAGVVSHSAFPYFAEQAIGSTGQVLGTSSATATPSHLAIYGHTAFVPEHGLAGVPVGCFVDTTCHIQTTVTRGRTVLARTNRERLAAWGNGIVYFSLTTAGRRLLQKAHGRLAVTVSLRDASGAKTGSELNLISFTTSGRAPRRSVTQSSAIRLTGLTDFVRAGGGGILAECRGPAPCHAGVTLLVGRTTIARTGSEFMGANELTYLSFHLTAQGRTLLADAVGNQLGVKAVVSIGAAAASGTLVLVRY